MSTEKFNAGDLVQCVDTRGVPLTLLLILGECYEVQEIALDRWLVVKDLQRQTLHMAEAFRFELVTPAGGWKEDEEDNETEPYITFSESFEDHYVYKPSCSHPEVVQSHALGQFFNYCRTCKHEVE